MRKALEAMRAAARADKWYQYPNGDSRKDAYVAALAALNAPVERMIAIPEDVKPTKKKSKRKDD